MVAGYAALQDIRIREVRFDGYSIYLQCNPKRIVSTGAKVDPASIGERKCFLCQDNLPQEQKGVLYNNEFLVLCNPAPIFDKHLTIAHVEHIPQTIEGFTATFLNLARDVSPGFTVFYNGPKCGASAPDHLHFQACPAGSIPVERDAGAQPKRQLRKTIGSASVYMLTDIGRAAIVVKGSDVSNVKSSFDRLITAMKYALRTKEEPMMNIICSYLDGMWRMIVFPRKKHRPDVYFKEGEERVVISPAAIDVGGLIVTPIEKDFNRVDAAMIQKIYDEVLIDGFDMERIFAML